MERPPFGRARSQYYPSRTCTIIRHGGEIGRFVGGKDGVVKNGSSNRFGQG